MVQVSHPGAAGGDSLSGSGSAGSGGTNDDLPAHGLGSVVAASDEGGNLLWRKAYAPYGEQIDSDQDDEALSYTGKPHDADLGLTYFGARYYDPVIGRFMSPDPIGFVEDNPMSFNRYAYASNNPYKYVDPDGQMAIAAVGVGVVIVGGLTALHYATCEARCDAITDVAARFVDSVGDAFDNAKPVGSSAGLALGALINMYNERDNGGDKGSSAGDADEPEAEGHRSNARPSTLEGHQRGDARRRSDKGREKGDVRRKRNEDGGGPGGSRKRRR